jgi:hypothetical protein
LSYLIVASPLTVQRLLRLLPKSGKRIAGREKLGTRLQNLRQFLDMREHRVMPSVGA